MSGTERLQGWSVADGESLKLARQAASKTQKDVADEIGVRQPTVSNWENGRAGGPTEEQEATIEAFLGRTIRSASEQSGSRTSSSQQYQIREKLGSGAFGDVYEAYDTVLRRPVAIKFARSSGAHIMPLVQQASALARAGHPNIVTVHLVAPLRDPSTHQVRDAIIMERLVGNKLSERLKGAKFTTAEAKLICVGLVDAASHLHKSGIVHQDLHSDNVMIVAGCQPKVLDPMHTSTLAGLEAAQKETRLQRDWLNLANMLVDVAKHTDLSPVRWIQLQRVVSPDEESLRAALVHVFDEGAADNPSRAEPPAAQGRRRILSAAGLCVAIAVFYALWRLLGGGGVRHAASRTPSPGLYVYASLSPRTMPEFEKSPRPTTSSPPASSAPFTTNCFLPKVESGLARRYLATSNTEAGALSQERQLRMALARLPGGSEWTTALRHDALPSRGRTKWVVSAASLSPSSAEILCDWLRRCGGWSEYCGPSVPL